MPFRFQSKTTKGEKFELVQRTLASRYFALDNTRERSPKYGKSWGIFTIKNIRNAFQKRKEI